MENTIREQREQLENQIISLKAQLSSNSSKIGDWKVIKFMEAKAAGDALPFTEEAFEAVLAQRRQVRNTINELEAQIAALPAEDAE